MTDQLFRAEVAAAQRDAWLSTVRIRPPRFGWWSLSAGALCLCVATALLFLESYTAHERVSGVLVSSSGILSLAPKDGGLISRVLARDGDQVRRDQVLFVLSKESATETLGDTGEEVARSLEMKRHHLEQDMRTEDLTLSAGLKALKRREESISLQIDRLSEQIAIERQRAEAARGLYEQWRRLEGSGLVSKVQALQQRDASLQIEATVKELERQLTGLSEEQSAVGTEVDNSPRVASLRQSAIARELIDVDRALAENEAHRSLIVRAPVDGRLDNLLVHVGQQVVADQSLANLVPTGSILSAEFWVPSHSIGEIRRSDKVILRYRAFPFQTFGQYQGAVQEISNVAVDGSSLEKILGKRQDEGAYRVRVTLPKQSVGDEGRELRLMPGMAVDGDILIKKQRLIDRVIVPIRKQW